MLHSPSIPQLIATAYAQALPPPRLFKTLQEVHPNNRSLSFQYDLRRMFHILQRLLYDFIIIAGALLNHLLPAPPSIMLAYLAHSLSTSIIATKDFTIDLLFYISNHEIPPIESLVPILNILMENSTCFEDGTILPSMLSDPVLLQSDTTGESSKCRNNNQTSTLSLILPLLRVSATPFSPPTLTAFVARLLNCLSPFPVPPLDVGLEAGQLLPSLADEVGIPLRNCLGGLMADATTNDPQQVEQVIFQQDSQLAQSHSPSQVEMSTNSSVPLKAIVAFLLEQAHRASQWDPSELALEMEHYQAPAPSYVRLLKAGQHICSNPEEFIVVLFEVSIERLISENGRSLIAKAEGMRDWGWVTESLPNLLRWWRSQREEDGFVGWRLPSVVAEPLTKAVQAFLPAMQSYSEKVLETYEVMVQSAEIEEESSGFTPPEAWQLVSLQEYLIGKLIEMDLITRTEANKMIPTISVPQTVQGQSLLERMESESRAHVKPLVFIITYAFGAAKSFAYEIIKIIKSSPQVPPPENLFLHVSYQPSIFSALVTFISPLSLYTLMSDRLLEAYSELDEFARSDDPQGYLTRFGEGVILLESFAREFNLDLPELLANGRRAIGYGLLNAEQKDCLNGWVKAIFGSDGIEDQILLATPPQTLCCLVPTLIQQAIAAVACNQIDLDTLHSGLSYFSQPLLSWCLGGVIGWLCDEILRQGALGALHLVVLQVLAMGHACPEQLLKVNDRALRKLINPLSGLDEVIGSSNFDMLAFKAKLESLGIATSHYAPPNQPSVESSLQSINTLPFATAFWANPLFDSLWASADASNWMTVVLKIIFSQLDIPPVSPVGSACQRSEAYANFVPFLLMVNIKGNEPLLSGLAVWLKNSTDELIHYTRDSRVLAGIFTQCTLLADIIWGRAMARRVIKELVAELHSVTALGIRSGEQSEETTQIHGRKMKHRDGRRLTSEQRLMCEHIIKTLTYDDELRARWGDQFVDSV
ncbi:hypothetical protein C361_04327 [Cryptococcus neoformans Tu259-1]|uniref:Mediator of RNA polymerase II transcription subunit 5 n=1 Tax=Cryptococcus neoformans Tu259-1 TaxID=1230072 RepID=A0A854QGE7_CRYNE|nr:hypothetical protein C361_04327 [Cryptococcus neoformans var. grubii Tu259-1]